MLSVRFGFDAIAGLLLALPCAVCAQGPVIKSVLNSASLDTRLAPGIVAHQSALKGGESLPVPDFGRA